MHINKIVFTSPFMGQNAHLDMDIAVALEGEKWKWLSRSEVGRKKKTPLQGRDMVLRANTYTSDEWEEACGVSHDEGCYQYVVRRDQGCHTK